MDLIHNCIGFHIHKSSAEMYGKENWMLCLSSPLYLILNIK
jgi:hypothetical protein